jgi:predicted dehydrogenase
MRRDARLAADYARRHGVARWYDNADALIQDPEVDAVYIATPVDTHASYALAVAAAGKPAYVEKPMARHTPECERMIEAFEAAGKPLFVAYYRRALPRFVRVRELLEAGAVGTVTSVRYAYDAPLKQVAVGALPWRVQARQSGGGLFLDLGCHALDVIDMLLGELSDVQGRADNRGGAYTVEDQVVMTFRTACGVPGTADWNFASAIREDRLEIVGLCGRLQLSVFGDSPLLLRDGHGDREVHVANPQHIQQPLIQSIVDALHGRGTCPSTGRTALRTARVMDAVLASYYGGRVDAYWEREATWPGRSLR